MLPGALQTVHGINFRHFVAHQKFNEFFTPLAAFADQAAIEVIDIAILLSQGAGRSPLNGHFCVQNVFICNNKTLKNNDIALNYRRTF